MPRRKRRRSAAPPAPVGPYLLLDEPLLLLAFRWLHLPQLVVGAVQVLEFDCRLALEFLHEMAMPVQTAFECPQPGRQSARGVYAGILQRLLLTPAAVKLSQMCIEVRLAWIQAQIDPGSSRGEAGNWLRAGARPIDIEGMGISRAAAWIAQGRSRGAS